MWSVTVKEPKDIVRMGIGGSIGAQILTSSSVHSIVKVAELLSEDSVGWMR